jgi:hypothetical protein
LFVSKGSRCLAFSAGESRSFATINTLSAQFYSLKAAPDKTIVAQTQMDLCSTTKTGGMPPST